MAIAAPSLLSLSLLVFVFNFWAQLQGIYADSGWQSGHATFYGRGDSSGTMGAWGRNLFTQDSTIKFSCHAGDCGPSTMACSGGGAAPPPTLFEFILNNAEGIDFYDVGLAHAGVHNAPTATNGGTGDAQYCCSGEYASPDTGKPIAYSEFFKNTCPQAYGFEDGTSIFTCTGPDYIISFCPGLSARLNLLTGTSVETNPSSTAPPSATHVLPRNPRRLLRELPDVNIHSHTPTTSNKKSWDLDKADKDIPSPPAPRGMPPVHQ